MSQPLDDIFKEKAAPPVKQFYGFTIYLWVTVMLISALFRIQHWPMGFEIEVVSLGGLLGAGVANLIRHGLKHHIAIGAIIVGGFRLVSVAANKQWFYRGDFFWWEPVFLIVVSLAAGIGLVYSTSWIMARVRSMMGKA